jgi:hypothetical protein
MSKVLPPLPEVKPPLPPPEYGAADRPSLEAPVNARTAPAPVKIETVEKKNGSMYTDVLGDAHDAVFGIARDVMSGNGSLYEVVSKNNRLRGLGVLLVILSILAAIFDILR